MREALLKIHKRKDGVFYVSVPGRMRHDGKRVKLYFPNQDDAEAEVEKLKRMRKADGINARHIENSLAIDATRAAKILRPWGKKLEEAALHYAKYLADCSKSVTFKALWEAHMEGISGRRERYVSNARKIGDKMIAVIGDRLVNTLTVTDIEEAMVKAGFTTPTMHNTAKAYIRPAFRIAANKGYAKENVVVKVATKTVAPREIEVLSLEEVRTVLASCQDYRERKDWRRDLRVDCRDAMAPVLFMLFAGVRPREAGQITWENVKLDHNVITVKAVVSKKGRKRDVPLEQTLLRWLELIPEDQKKGLIAPSNWERKWKAIRKAAGIEDKQDVLRHSYASYWLAAFTDKNRLMINMGHADPKTIEEFYNANVPKADANAFWRIVPEGAEAPEMFSLVG